MTKEEAILQLGLDPAPIKRDMMSFKDQAKSWASSTAKAIADEFKRGVRGSLPWESTIHNRTKKADPRAQYAEEFKALLDARDKAEAEATAQAKRAAEQRAKEEAEASVRAATRSNTARRLLRQRAAEAERKAAITEQQKLDAEVEQAARDNLARRLRRERAMKREAAEAARADAELRNTVGRASGKMADEATGKFRELKQVIGAMGVGTFITKLFSFGDDIKDLAEITGATTDFVQGWAKMGDKVGPGADKATRGLERFNTLLGEAREGSEEAIKIFERLGVAFETGRTDEVLRRVADRFAEIPDPTLRAAAAVDLFGKHNSKLALMLERGSGEIDSFIENVDKLSEKNIQTLDKADKQLQGYGEQLKLSTAKILGLWGDFWSAMGTAAGVAAGGKSMRPIGLDKQATADHQAAQAEAVKLAKEKAEIEKIEEKISRERAEGDKAAADTKIELQQRLNKLIKESGELAEKGLQQKGLEAAKTQLEWEKKRNEILETQKKIEQEVTKEKAEQTRYNEKMAQYDKMNREIGRTKADIAKEQKDFKTGQLEDYMPTLQEIAESGTWVGRGKRRRFRQGQFARTAKDLMKAEERLKRDLLHYGKDNINLEKRQEYIGSLKKRLADAGLMKPEETMAEKTKEMAERLADLVEGRKRLAVEILEGEE